MNTPEPLPSQVYIEQGIGNWAHGHSKVRRSAIAGFPWLTFAGWVLVFILAIDLVVVPAAEHVIHYIATTVGQAHVKAMY